MWKRRFATSRKALPVPNRACTATALSSRLGQRAGMSPDERPVPPYFQHGRNCPEAAEVDRPFAFAREPPPEGRRSLDRSDSAERASMAA
jgi:hypothetical protein